MGSKQIILSRKEWPRGACPRGLVLIIVRNRVLRNRRAGTVRKNFWNISLDKEKLPVYYSVVVNHLTD